jgi:hypothetical protein
MGCGDFLQPVWPKLTPLQDSRRRSILTTSTLADTSLGLYEGLLEE